MGTPCLSLTTTPLGSTSTLAQATLAIKGAVGQDQGLRFEILPPSRNLPKEGFVVPSAFSPDAVTCIRQLMNQNGASQGISDDLDTSAQTLLYLKGSANGGPITREAVEVLVRAQNPDFTDDQVAASVGDTIQGMESTLELAAMATLPPEKWEKTGLAGLKFRKVPETPCPELICPPAVEPAEAVTPSQTIILQPSGREPAGDFLSLPPAAVIGMAVAFGFALTAGALGLRRSKYSQSRAASTTLACLDDKIRKDFEKTRLDPANISFTKEDKMAGSIRDGQTALTDVQVRLISIIRLGDRLRLLAGRRSWGTLGFRTGGKGKNEQGEPLTGREREAEMRIVRAALTLAERDLERRLFERLEKPIVKDIGDPVFVMEIKGEFSGHVLRKTWRGYRRKSYPRTGDIAYIVGRKEAEECFPQAIRANHLKVAVYSQSARVRKHYQLGGPISLKDFGNAYGITPTTPDGNQQFQGLLDDPLKAHIKGAYNFLQP